MFASDFDPATTLADARCPRCKIVGLELTDRKTLDQAPPRDRHVSQYSVEPSIAARCPECGLVGEWPGMSWRVAS